MKKEGFGMAKVYGSFYAHYSHFAIYEMADGTYKCWKYINEDENAYEKYKSMSREAKEKFATKMARKGVCKTFDRLFKAVDFGHRYWQIY